MVEKHSGFEILGPLQDAADAGAAGEVLTSQGAGNVPAWVADYPQKLKPAVTRYVIPGWYAAVSTVRGMTAGRIYYIPIFVEETTTYIAICINVETLDAGTADLRIFVWDDGLPGALILSAGTVDTGGTGAKEIAISQELTRGYYFLAIRCSANPSLWGLDSASAISSPVAGLYTSSSAKTPYVILYVTAAYTDPAPAPADATDVYFVVVYLKET